MRVSGIERAGEFDAERSVDQVSRDSGFWGEPERLLVEREMRTREMLGKFWLTALSCERNCVPTPPTPVHG